VDAYNFLFFPGVVFHELSHLLACILLGVRVTKVKFWGTSEAFVQHEISTLWKNIGIALAPFGLSTFTAFTLIHIANTTSTLQLKIIAYYFAFSIAFHGFPSHVDVNNATKTFIASYKNFLSFKTGMLTGLVYWITLPILFLPTFIWLKIMKSFTRFRYLGATWFLALVILDTLFLSYAMI